MTTPEAIAAIELALQHAAETIAELAAAVVTLHSIAADDRDTIGALAGDINRHDDELKLTATRLDEHDRRIDSYARTLDERTSDAA